jgi:amino acid transporter
MTTAAATGRPGRLRRELRFLETAAVSVGVMAPTLAMSVTGSEAAKTLGAAAPLAFVVAGLGVGLVAYGFVRLAAEFAHAGSVYAFVGNAIGPRAGFVAGWALLGTYLVFPPVSMMGVAIFGRAALRSTGLVADADWYPLALAGLAVVALLAMRGIKPTTRSVLAFEAVSLAVIAVVMVAIYAHAFGGDAPAAQRLSTDVVRLPPGVGLTGLAIAATTGFLAFAGFESAGSLGEESVRPTRAIPRAIVLAIGIGAVFYVLCMVAQTIGFGTDAAGTAAFTGSEAPLDTLATRYVGSSVAAAIDVGAVLSALGAGLGGVTVAARMMFSFGRDGLVWRRLAAVDAATGVPRRALALEVAVAAVLLTAYRIGGAAPLTVFFHLATIGVLNLLVMYVLTNLAAVRRLRQRAPREVVLPLAGTLIAGFVLYHTVWPVPPAPFRWFPYLVAVWLLGGFAVTAVRAGFVARITAGLTRSQESGRTPAEHGVGA